MQIGEKAIMTEFDTEPTFRVYLQVLRHRKGWVGSITALGLVGSAPAASASEVALST
jgi:hypothetical protein